MNRARVHTGRIVLTTFGSLGDLNPFIALARGLQKRGYRPVIATSAYYRDHVRSSGIAFQPVRPDLDPGDKGLIRRVMHPRKGTEVIIRDIVFPAIEATYADLDVFLQHNDILITHPIGYAAHIIAEKRGLTWISAVLSPIVFLSAHDLSVLQGFPFAHLLENLGPAVCRYMIKAVKSVTRRWCRPVDRLRATLGLGPGKHPLFDGQHSPFLVLAMFSRVLARPQDDWPPHTRITGFGFYDATPDRGALSPELEKFLNTGPPPVVFTLGSVAVHTAVDFYRMAATASVALNRRAVLVVGKDTNNLPAEGLPPNVMSVDYVPHSKLFPKAVAIVHQGGIGTTGQALQAGKPTLVVPFAHDQPDNARRLERLGTSNTLPLRRCTSQNMTRALEALLKDTRIGDRADALGESVRSENGIFAACDAIDALVAATNQSLLSQKGVR
jgi:UDP:flavonoid glycosyltransferase YjiC (YdhE family)